MARRLPLLLLLVALCAPPAHAACARRPGSRARPGGASVAPRGGRILARMAGLPGRRRRRPRRVERGARRLGRGDPGRMLDRAGPRLLSAPAGAAPGPLGGRDVRGDRARMGPSARPAALGRSAVDHGAGRPAQPRAGLPELAGRPGRRQARDRAPRAGGEAAQARQAPPGEPAAATSVAQPPAERGERREQQALQGPWRHRREQQRDHLPVALGERRRPHQGARPRRQCRAAETRPARESAATSSRNVCSEEGGRTSQRTCAGSSPSLR